MFKRFFQTPEREYIFISLATIVLLFNFVVQDTSPVFFTIILVVALLGSLSTLARAFSTLINWGFSIDVLYLIALLILFFEGNIISIIFISLIFSLGRLFDFYVYSTSKNITKNFYDKIPQTTFRQNKNVYDEVLVEKVKNGDILIIKEKEIVPVDGIVIFGEGQVNEVSVTGLSMPVKKVLNDKVFSSSVVNSGIIKIRAICTSKESVFFRKIKIIKEFGKKSSYSQYFANKLAEYFLPFVFFTGIVIYLITDNTIMMAALFLVISRKGVTSAVSLHSKKVLHLAAKYGVIVKNNRKFEILGKTKAVVLDKTDILTFGSFQIKDVQIEEGISKTDFWTSVAIAEKYSEDLVNKILFREAMKYTEKVPDAHKYQVYKSAGVFAQYGRDNIVIGNKKLLSEVKIKFPKGFQKKLTEKNEKYDYATVFVAINNIFIGSITITDVPEKSVCDSVKELHKIGVENVVMFTSRNERFSQNFADAIGVDKILFSLSSEEKRAEVKLLSKMSTVAVVGDGGANYSKFLFGGADVAMGKECGAVIAHNSDIVIFNDDLRLLPKLILSSRSLTGVIYGNIGTWIITNATGVTFVLVGIINPVFAILYSFIVESVNFYLFFRLQRSHKKKHAK